VNRAVRWACWTTLFVVSFAFGCGFAVLWLKFTTRQEAPLPQERWEATVYLPAPAADTPFTQQDWDEAVGLLVKEFEGATLGAEVEGLWRGADGKLQREKVRPVIVTFDTHRLADFRRVLDEVGRRLKQEAVYARFEKPRVELRRTGATP